METDWTISASTISDNVSLLKRINGTHQCLEYVTVLDRWTRYEWIYQILEGLILLDCWTGTEWAISASTGSDNISSLNRNNGTHQFLEYLMALDRWIGNEYQLLEYLISDCWSGTVWDISASTGSDVNSLNRNKMTHRFLEYLKALDYWTRNEWIYQLLECLIILDCWTGSEWDISAYRAHDDVSFWTQAWASQRRTYILPNDGIAGWSINQHTKIYVCHHNVRQNHNTQPVNKSFGSVEKSQIITYKKRNKSKSHSRRN